MNEKYNIDKQKLINTILNSKDKKINSDAINRAQKGDISSLVSGLDEQSKKKLTEALGDKRRAAEILSSKEAKDILKKFLTGGKQNG